MRVFANRLEWMLAGIAMLMIAAGWLSTFWTVVEDRELTRSSSIRIIDSLAVSLEEHLATTLQGARNSAYAAALLIENAGGFGGFRSEESLHRELNRELQDYGSTARLVAADGRGRIVASSAEYPLAPIPAAPHAAFSWHESHPAERGFHLGVPHESAISGKTVIPYSRAVFDKSGAVTGVVVAELSTEYLAKLYAALTGGIQASIVVFNHDGIILMRTPYDRKHLGRSATSPAEFRKMLEASGNTEYASVWDGTTRYYSHRVMQREFLLVAVGVTRDEVMAPAAIRTRHRMTVMGAVTLVFVALAWLLMAELRLLARSEERLRALSRRLIDVEEIERRSINRELHDRIGQNLSALQLNLGTLRMELGDSALQSVRARLNDAQALLESTSNQVRDVMTELRPAALDDFGLLAALREHAATVSARAGIAIGVTGSDPEPRLPLATEIALFRIVQETLNNVAKHARARNVEVRLEATPQSVRLSVADDGEGFDARRPMPRAGHYGIATMRERAEAVGARMKIEAAPRQGTRVELEVALTPVAR